MNFYTQHQKDDQFKKKDDKLNLVKSNNFCIVKDIAKEMKRQVTDWEKIICKTYIC